MTDDLAKRLRVSADAYERATFTAQAAQLREAADRIDADGGRIVMLDAVATRERDAGSALRRRIEVLEDALRAIINVPLPLPVGQAHRVRAIARRALSRGVPVVGSATEGEAT